VCVYVVRVYVTRTLRASPHVMLQQRHEHNDIPWYLGACDNVTHVQG
jgi:hypothetical protein